jgi:large subunit ribosomal protein L19
MATRDFVKEVEKRYMKDSLPDFKPGDSVKVKIKITEGNKERLQAYEGVIIKIRGAGINKTVTVRRVFQGIGVERVFLVHSPKVDSIQILRKGDVRRAKLYYLRQRTGKAARIREKIGAIIDKPESKKAQQQQPAPAEVVAEAPQAAEPVAEVVAETETPVVAEQAAPEVAVAEAAPEVAVAEEATPEAPVAETPAEETTEAAPEEPSAEA